MRDVMWIYAVVIFLLSKAWSKDTGTNQSSNVNSSAVYVARNEAFNQGSQVKLTCSSKTWNETMFVVWSITLKTKETCTIAFNNGSGVDTCNDGKSLRNTSSFSSYLHIPNFSDNDEGLYKCESVYTGGNDNRAFQVTIIVPPSTSVWLDHKDNKMVAVCKAERGKPAAQITWSHTGNISSVKTSQKAQNGFFSVESRLELLEGTDIGNLSCVIRHHNSTEKILFVLQHEQGYPPWLYVLIVVVIVVLLAGFLFFAQKKIITLRRCQQSDSSPSKSLPAEHVEEVEPYASYVQRVNSIYNSSADLFT
ncbi:cell surface glycoprotein CD200 receptor 1 [Clinocottus analis]|uniref:cell surface glycoprotein CD200 receptor 1 n=1 Tax=Clinocottus analis TaxID=304258 RepID=UPI0035BF8048